MNRGKERGRYIVKLVDDSMNIHEVFYAESRFYLHQRWRTNLRIMVEEGEIVRSAFKDRNIFFLTARLSCIYVCSVVDSWYSLKEEVKRGERCVLARDLPLINEKSINGRIARNSEERQRITRER